LAGQQAPAVDIKTLRSDIALPANRGEFRRCFAADGDRDQPATVTKLP
jgi:hypothetical protein